MKKIMLSYSNIDEMRHLKISDITLNIDESILENMCDGRYKIDGIHYEKLYIFDNESEECLKFIGYIRV